MSGSGAEGIWTFGRDPACDIVVSDPAVSWHHGRLVQSAGTYSIEDLNSRSGTYVRGSRIYAPVSVARGETVRLGEKATLPWPAAGPARAQIRIGSHPKNDVVLDVPTVSPWHARITFEAGGPVLEDLGSTQGTSIQNLGNRIRRAPLAIGDAVYFGSYRVTAEQLLKEKRLARGATVVVPEAAASGAIPEAPAPLRVAGRNPQAAIPVNHASVSWKHAEVRAAGSGFEIRDAGSFHGTFVNGERISGWRPVRSSDEIVLGTVLVRLQAQGEIQILDYGNGCRLQLQKVTCAHLEPISFSILPAELVAIVGPSAAGKTTLLQMVSGYVQPTAGDYTINGLDFQRHRDQFRLQIGYVPQEDILHAQLTPYEALLFTAKLRTDLSPAETEARIDRVLSDLQITDAKHKVIGSVEKKLLSGGERKRVSMALELLCSPPLLLMDEPTSGLSSEDAENVVRLVRELSTAGSTVVMTIHQPSADIFRLFDSLIVIGRDRPQPGRCVYFGPAFPDSLEFFNLAGVQQTRLRGMEPRPELLLKGMESRTAREWEATYADSSYHRSYVTGRAADKTGPATHRKRRAFGTGLRQVIPLLHRNILVKSRDRGQLMTFALQAPIVGILIALASGGLQEPSAHFADFKEWRQYVGRIASTHFMLAVASVWFGCNNAAREIVGEWPIYKRERMVNLAIPAYIFSKFTVLAAVAAIQCAILLGISTLAGLQSNLVSAWFMLTLMSLIGVASGLCISAARRTTEQAIAILPIVLLPVIMFAGGLRPLHESGDAVRAIASVMPTRWGFEANLVSEACNRTYRYDPPPPMPPPVTPSSCAVADIHFPEPRTSWWRGAAYLGFMIAVLTGLTGFILKWRDRDDHRKVR